MSAVVEWTYQVQPIDNNNPASSTPKGDLKWQDQLLGARKQVIVVAGVIDHNATATAMSDNGEHKWRAQSKAEWMYIPSILHRRRSERQLTQRKPEATRPWVKTTKQRSLSTPRHSNHDCAQQSSTIPYIAKVRSCQPNRGRKTSKWKKGIQTEVQSGEHAPLPVSSLNKAQQNLRSWQNRWEENHWRQVRWVSVQQRRN